MQTLVRPPRYEIDLTPRAAQQPDWFDTLCERYRRWADTRLQRQAAARARRAHATLLCHLAPHLLSDIGCPGKLRDEVQALRRGLRLAAADALVH